MPLLDHFRPPLSVRRHWSAFHNAWANCLAFDLNDKLPKGYFAEANVSFRIEIDVATFVDEGLQTSSSSWQAPEALQTLTFPLVGEVAEVLIYGTSGGPTLAGAIELVSPANKDRPAHREAFTSKCETYLQQGVGLIIVDIVTERLANMHNELLARIDPNAEPLAAELYASAYRVIQDNGDALLKVWPKALTLGQDLPTLPLWLRGGLCLPVELDQVYRRTCAQYRIEVNGH